MQGMVDIKGYEPAHYLYRAFSAEDVLLYVGITSNVRLRVGQHAASKLWWPEVSEVRVEPFPDKATARAAERAAITADQPRYNLVHTDQFRTTRQGRRVRQDEEVPVDPTHLVGARREGHWWMVEIPSLDGLTQARRLSDVREQARDYIATWLDIDPEAIRVGVTHIQVGAKDYAATRLELEALREEARRAEDAAARLARDTAKALAAEDVPVRDIGDVLGVSFQRASQLVNA
jgi:hypothetical protein